MQATKEKECLLCGCSKDLHSKYGSCRGNDEEGYDCICDYYESAPATTEYYCDSCLTVAYDRVGHGLAEQVELLQSFGEYIEDHDCDSIIESGLTTCNCRAHR